MLQWSKQHEWKEEWCCYTDQCRGTTHCYGHALNLAAADTIKQNKLLRDALDITSKISKLLKYSPRCDSLFEMLKQQLAPDVLGFRTLCPTR